MIDLFVFTTLWYSLDFSGAKRLTLLFLVNRMTEWSEDMARDKYKSLGLG